MKKILITAVVFAAALMVSCTPGERGGVIISDDGGNFGEDETQDAAHSSEIVVYVTGAVVSPGVYTLYEGDRIYQLIDMAGGFRDDAAQGAVNLAEVLSDGQQINICTAEEYESEKEAAKEAGSGLVNINTATKEELMTLPGIGEAKADLIISYRNTQGSFKNAEDIKNISGIKDGVYSRIKDYICIE